MTLLFRESLLRADDNGRTIYGLAVPYGVTATVDDGLGPYRERFAPGAFTRSIRERGSKIRLFTMHESRRLPIGRPVDLTEHRDGLHAAFMVAATRDGDEALELVRSGTVNGFSIGFAPVRERKVEGVVERIEASLREVSLVWQPAYESALVAGVRSAPASVSVDVARRRLDLVLKTFS